MASAEDEKSSDLNVDEMEEPEKVEEEEIEEEEAEEIQANTEEAEEIMVEEEAMAPPEEPIPEEPIPEEPIPEEPIPEEPITEEPIPEEPIPEEPIPEEPEAAPLAYNDDPPPEKPISSGTTLFLEERYDEMTEKYGGLPDEEFKENVKKEFRLLPVPEQKSYKKRARKLKDDYYDSLETYLVTHPHYIIDETDQAGLQKRRAKRAIEEAAFEQQQRLQAQQTTLTKKPKKKRKKKKRKLSQRTAEEQYYQEDMNENFQQEYNSGDEELPFPHDSPGTPLPKSKKKKKQLNAEEDALIKNHLESLVTRMKQAAAKDRRLFSEGKVAIEKHKILPEVRKHFELAHFHEYLVEKCEALDALRDWLTPYPGGHLPELKLRTDLYRLIFLLQMHKLEPDTFRDHILMCEQRTQALKQQDSSKQYLLPFGKLINYLCQNKRETVANRKFLKNLLLGWCRNIVGTGGSVNTKNSEEIRARADQVRRQKTYWDTLKSKRARAPKQPWFDFVNNAPKQIDSAESEITKSSESNQTRNSINQKFRLLKRR